MNKGNITFSEPFIDGGTKWYAEFKIDGNVEWNGGTFNPGIDATDTLNLNIWTVTGTMTVTAAANNPNKPTIQQDIQFLPPNQQPSGTWYVIQASGQNAKLQGDDPLVPTGWTLDTTTDGNGNKKKWGVHK